MRRAAPLLILALLAACATPPIRLSPRFAVGDRRTYRLSSDADTRVSFGGRTLHERTSLSGRTQIEVISLAGDEATVRLTLTPERLTRDGANLAAPAAQQVELIVGPDGGVRRVASVGGLPATIAGTDFEDLAPVIGIALPPERVRVGAALPLVTPSAGVQQGRVTGVRVVRGYDCALVALGRRRPLTRERDIAGQQVRLDGIEDSNSLITFAFRAGFPVELSTSAQGTFTIDSAPAQGGTVKIATTTELRLLTSNV